MTELNGQINPRELLRGLFDAAIAAVDPMLVMPPYLKRISDQWKPSGRVIVMGAGKAAARMALAVEQHWPGPVSGMVVTRYGHGEPCKQIEVIEAAHPVPDEAGMQAAGRMLGLAASLSENDLVLCLVSGGGSALLTLPAPGISLEDKRAINKALLASGAAIGEMNRVRRHLSAIKGGKLAEACGRARVVTLVLSDVPNDDATVVASGPTLADSSNPQDAAAILARYGIACPPGVREHLARAPIPTQQAGPREHYVIAGAQHALDAAAAHASAHGFKPLILGGSIEGESRDVAAVHAGIARQVTQHAQPCARPCVILSGGETTVTVRGNGRGGRNAEFLLSLAIAARDVPELYALACDTDGVDGVEDNAGAMIGADTQQRALAAGLDARAYLARNDAYHYFLQLNDLTFTGPTRTNVNDFRALLLP